MTERPIRVCLIGHSTRSDNLGVGALTVSEIEILREIANNSSRRLEITVMDYRDPRQSYVSGPDITVIEIGRRVLLSPKGYFAIARRADVVIDIGGGDSFADIYGARRIRRMLYMQWLAHLARTPVVFAPQTIGPFGRGWTRRIAAASLKRAVLVASRDRLSTEAARALGAKNVTEASDVALRLPYDQPTPRALNTAAKVGLNVSGLLMGGGYTGKNEFGIKADYPALIRDLIRYFQGEGAEVHLVAHVMPETSERTHLEDDTSANAQLSQEFPDVVVAPRFATPSEAKSYIAGLDFFMGARMHACIAAFSSGVPVVPMAYSRKFEGLFGTLGYDRTVDCRTEDAETIIAAVKTGWRERQILAEEVQSARNVGLKKLNTYEKALRSVLMAADH